MPKIIPSIEQHEGRPHLVVGAWLAPEVPAEFAILWNSRPLLCGTPDKGTEIMIRPSTLDRLRIGTIFNVGSESRCLSCDVWLDVARAEALAPDVLTKLRTGRPVGLGTLALEINKVYCPFYAMSLDDMPPGWQFMMGDGKPLDVQIPARYSQTERTVIRRNSEGDISVIEKYAAAPAPTETQT